MNMKRDSAFIGAFLTAVFLSSCNPAITPQMNEPVSATPVSVSTGIRGDLDENGVIDAGDAQTALMFYVDSLSGMESNITDQQMTVGDINGDHSIDAVDAQLILMYYVQNELAGLQITWEDLLNQGNETQPLQTELTQNETAPLDIDNKTPNYTDHADQVLLDCEKIWLERLQNTPDFDYPQNGIAWFEDLDIGDNQLEWIVQNKESKECIIFKIDGDTIEIVGPTKWSMYGRPTAAPPSDSNMPSYVQFYLWNPNTGNWRDEIAEVVVEYTESMHDGSGSTTMDVYPRNIVQYETPEQINNYGKWVKLEYPLVQCTRIVNDFYSILPRYTFVCYESNLIDGDKEISTEKCREIYDSYLTKCDLYQSQHSIIHLNEYFAGSREQKAEMLRENRESFTLNCANDQRPDNLNVKALMGQEAIDDSNHPRNMTGVEGWIRHDTIYDPQTMEEPVLHRGDTVDIDKFMYNTENGSLSGSIQFWVYDQSGERRYLDESDLITRPTAKYVSQATDEQLKELAAVMQRQYNSLMQDYYMNGGTLNLKNTMQYDDQQFERLDPSATWDDLMAEYHRFYADDVYVTCNGQESKLSTYIKEKDGVLWRQTGYGGPSIPTSYEAVSIDSRTDSEIVFNMKITKQFPGSADSSEIYAPFALRLEDGYWKCSQIELSWFAI